MKRHSVTHLVVNTLFWLNVLLGAVLCAGLILLSGQIAAFYDGGGPSDDDALASYICEAYAPTVAKVAEDFDALDQRCRAIGALR